MIDWNHDGKIDWKDDAFFHNVVKPGIEKDEQERKNNANKQSSSPSSGSTEPNVKGWIIFIVICIIAFIGGLLGD